MQEQELFQGYEVKNWDLSPRIYKILAVSAIFNILALLIVGQTNLLTKKGCDSPLVGKVCQVIDTLYVGSTVLTTKSDYVNKEYDPTEITPDDEITFVNVADKLYYPQDYAGFSNPDLAALNNPEGTFPPMDPTNGFSTFPGIPNPTNPTNPTTGGGLLNSKPELPPKTKGDTIIGDLPTSPYGNVNGVNPTITRRNYPNINGRKNKKIPQTSPTQLPNVNKENDKNTTAETDKEKDKNQKDLTSKSESDVEINTKPLKDLKGFVNDLRTNKGFAISSPFSVQAKGKLDKNGKIDSKNFKIIKAESPDQNMIAVVTKSITSINDSGYLQYLTNLSGKDLEFNFKQDGTALTAVIQSELESDTRANSISSALNFFMQYSKSKKEKAIASMQAANKPEEAQNLQNEMDDLELLKNAKVTNDGKKIIIEFIVPQDVATKMIERKLNEPDKPEDTKAQSTAPVSDNNKNNNKKAVK
jgi:hypothetical protein